jgi:hypothetical protein
LYGAGAGLTAKSAAPAEPAAAIATSAMPIRESHFI